MKEESNKPNARMEKKLKKNLADWEKLVEISLELKQQPNVHNKCKWVLSILLFIAKIFFKQVLKKVFKELLETWWD